MLFRSATLAVLASLTLIGLIVALYVWPRHDPEIVRHRHDDLPADHPHLKDGHATARSEHEHPMVIDALHAHWPRTGPT